jgi:Family of unknown function (DUF6114)
VPADGRQGGTRDGDPGDCGEDTEEFGQTAWAHGTVAGGQSGQIRRAWRAWRNWRRTRPFWGGLLVIAGGAEILSTSVVSLGVALRAGLGGLGGFPGTVVALVLALSGVLLWFSPAQRVFYSIVAVVLAIATFNTINYGGFFIGMLLGIIGGSLAFAWTPEPGGPRRRDRRQPQAGGARGRGRRTGLWPPRGGSGAPGLLAIAAIPLIAALPAPAAVRSAPAAVRSAPAAARDTRGCILIIICPSPTPSVPAGTPPPMPGPPGTAGGTSPAPTAPRPAGTGPHKPAKAPAPGKNRRAAAPGLVVAAAPSELTAASARLAGLAYEGVAEVPVATGPPLQMMKFTLSSVTLTGRPTLTIHEHGSTAVTTTSALSFSGHVVLYATKLSGDLLGVPVTVTASSPLSVVLQVLKPLTRHATVTMTQVVTDHPLTTSTSSVWSNFLISVQ